MQNPPSLTRNSWTKLIFVIFLGTMIFNCQQVNKNLAQTCYNGNCLVYKTWGQNIDNTINQQAVGYAYIIINNGLQMESKAWRAHRPMR